MTDRIVAPDGDAQTRSGFRPAAWLPGPHLPTIWASLFRRTTLPSVHEERFELDDGDFVDLVWAGSADGPVVIILHGLEGNLASSYVRALLHALAAAGYRAVLLQFRGCSGVPNRLDRTYHAGDTGDLAAVVARITTRHGRPPFAAVGYSLGGNVLLKWLGTLADAAPVTCAVAVSVPYDLGACADRLNQGFSRVYQRRLLRSMQAKYLHKFAARPAPIDPGRVQDLATFWDFDDAVIAPLHGFRDVHDYYARSSSRQFLPGITRPTLLLHAADDPFVPASAIPASTELGAATALELSTRGGHVGFVSNQPTAYGPYWLEHRILSYFETHQD